MTEIALSSSTKLTPTGLTIDTDLAFEDWEQIGAVLASVRETCKWATGDWYLWGEAAFGDLAAQAVEASEKSATTILEYVRVARAIPPPRRRRALSWTHHQVVAARTTEEQERLLREAESNGWSAAQLRAILRSDPALSARRSENRPDRKTVELVFEVGRAVLRASEPLDARHARVSLDMLGRLANALGEEPPLPPGQQQLVDLPAESTPPEWA